MAPKKQDTEIVLQPTGMAPKQQDTGIVLQATFDDDFNAELDQVAADSGVSYGPPSLLFNTTRKNPATGRRYPIDVFVNADTEETRPSYRGTILLVHSTRKLADFDLKRDPAFKVHCGSADLVAGYPTETADRAKFSLGDGISKACASCPQSRRGGACSVVKNIIFIEEGTMRPFLVTAWRTSRAPVDMFYRKYLSGQRLVRRKNPETGAEVITYADLPWFSYPVELSLRVEQRENTNEYAVLEINTTGQRYGINELRALKAVYDATNENARRYIAERAAAPIDPPDMKVLQEATGLVSDDNLPF